MSEKRIDPGLADLAEQTIAHALARGAREAAVGISRARFVDLKRRDGKVETLQASTSRGLSLALYVDGRFSSNGTSFLDPAEVRRFVDETVAMTRRLAPDPYRYLPDPALYGPTAAELDLEDPGYDAVDMDRREALVAAVEQAARREAGEALISVSAEAVTQAYEGLQLHSNGFCGEVRATSFSVRGTATVRDEGGRRPEEHAYAVARHLEDLAPPETVGLEAAERALLRRGSRKAQSGVRTMVVESRAAGRLVGVLLEPLSAAALQQHRSCFEGALGREVASPRLTIVDEPLIKRGLGSRTFDGEGLAARPLTVFRAGRLESYFIDVYYGRKLGLGPTTGSVSNLVLAPGTRDLDALVVEAGSGILVTGFLGGNSNPATGDFSFGIRGFELERGERVGPVGEMNITGNLKSLWRSLAEVGSDPYPHSSLRVPSLVFEGVQFSGV